jgi:methyl-accepting chemotaxis protein
MMATTMLMQVELRTLEALERIAVAQIVMATVIGLLGLLSLGAGIVVLLEIRRARRAVHGLSRKLDDLTPRLAPLIDRAVHLTDDVAAMTDNIRRKVDDLLHTAETLNRSVQRGSAATQERLQRFAAVLDIAQAEAEELLLDAAATAHGMQETVRVLRGGPGDGQRRRQPAATARDEDRDHEEEAR